MHSYSDYLLDNDECEVCSEYLKDKSLLTWAKHVIAKCGKQGTERWKAASEIIDVESCLTTSRNPTLPMEAREKAMRHLFMLYRINETQ